MAPLSIQPGTLAFMGPCHAPALSEFGSVRAEQMAFDEITVRCVRPDQEDGDTLEFPLSIMQNRAVDAAEADMWPGAYVGHPVAFVQPFGRSVSQWVYGVVPCSHLDHAST